MKRIYTISERVGRDGRGAGQGNGLARKSNHIERVTSGLHNTLSKRVELKAEWTSLGDLEDNAREQQPINHSHRTSSLPPSPTLYISLFVEVYFRVRIQDYEGDTYPADSEVVEVRIGLCNMYTRRAEAESCVQTPPCRRN